MGLASPPPVLDELPPRLPGIGPYRRADFLTARQERRCELLYGHLVARVADGMAHDLVRGEVLRRLAAWSQRAQATPSALDLSLAEHSVVTPDAALFRRRGPSDDRASRDDIPDLAVEVLSPASARLDRDVKLRLYAECGVREYWLIDAGARTVDFLVLAAGRRYVVATANDGIHRSRALPGLTFDSADLWWDVDQLSPLGL